MLRANPPLWYQLHKVWSHSYRPSVITRIVHHCLESLWENLEQQWLCAVLLLCLNKDGVHLGKKNNKPWCVWLLTYCGNLTDLSSTKIQNRETSAIKQKFIIYFYKYLPIQSRLNYHPLCLNRILNSNLASLTLWISSEFY